jgi:hypothetical protein
MMEVTILAATTGGQSKTNKATPSMVFLWQPLQKT